jgi:hypothetical protein
MAVDQKILLELQAQTLLLETIIALLDANKRYGVAAHFPYTASNARKQVEKVTTG